MGSHAGCSSATCNLLMSLNTVALTGLPEEQKATLMNAPLPLSFLWKSKLNLFGYFVALWLIEK